jgi:5S rRNA maturation endonuclease (ribonuclease M5)
MKLQLLSINEKERKVVDFGRYSGPDYYNIEKSRCDIRNGFCNYPKRGNHRNIRELQGAMLNTSKKMPSADDIERSERLREVLAALIEVNKRVPVIVEGKRDALALKKLGLVGEVITLHGGKGIYEFCEDIAEKFPKVMILLDWDEKGEKLYSSLSGNLTGHWEEFSAFRGIIKILCQKDIKDIEGIPKLLARLEGNEYTR